MATNQFIVMQCYGDESIFYECAYALLSFSRMYGHQSTTLPEIWIYTDKPTWFSRFKGCDLPLRFREFDVAQLQQWRGTIDFVHRVKIEILLDFTNSHYGDVLYIDTDMVLTHNLQTLWEGIAHGNLYMHLNEGKVADRTNPIFSKLHAYLTTTRNTAVVGKQLETLTMWNAGLLGFSTTKRHLLQEVLTFTDAVYPDFRKHVVEQFAFSVAFQQAGAVKSGLPYFLHFWNMKEARHVFTSFFTYFKNEDWHTLCHYTGLIQLYDLTLQKIWFERNRSFLDRLMSKKWQPPTVDWGAKVLEV